MNQLTEQEHRVLNSMSHIRDANVLLGDILSSLIGASCETGTPVNAINASAILDINGVVVDGETFTIGDDTYEFLADTAQSKSVLSHIGIDITAKTVKAFGTLTVDTQPVSGNTFTIGARTYIFVPVGTANAEGEISIGADLAGAKTAIVAAINGTDGHNTPHPTVTASVFTVDACTITALIGGTVGNSIATTETFTAETNIFAAGTLGSGENCAASDAAASVISAITENSISLVSAVAGTGTDVNLTAKTAGVSANILGLSDTMANASFTNGVTLVASLTGGVNGTVASGMKFMADLTYMYFCPAGNTIADKNWRRVSLGSVY